MSPEIHSSQLKRKSRLGVNRALERMGLEFSTDMGGVDVYHTEKDDPILIVPERNNQNRVDRVFYLEGSEEYVKPLVTDGTIFDAQIAKQEALKSQQKI